MDTAYLYILAAAAIGAVLGLLIPVKVLGVLVGGALGALLVGLVAAGVFGWDNGTWFFGLALMVAPLYGGAVFGGAVLSNDLAQSRRRRRARDQSSDDAV